MKIPAIIQGGMGAGISGWRLARCVSELGHLGVVSGTALDEIMARRLQEGDPGGHLQRALAALPIPGVAERILRKHLIPGGRPPQTPYLQRPMHTIEGSREAQEMCVAANFAEIFLAREGHASPIGINYLEKIQLPHLPSLYGALLAGAAVVIMGAGIPLEIPAAMAALAEHRTAEYTVSVNGRSRTGQARLCFNPATLHDGGVRLAPLERPAFLPIVSSTTLAMMLLRRIPDDLAGFIIEGHTAGGHNAPPRGALLLSDSGQPVYGVRDTVDLASFRRFGKPFWLAGSHGSPEGLRAALKEGASGIQVGTAFALCTESELAPDLRRALVRKALRGTAKIVTDPHASPTGFPFKVVELEGTLSDSHHYRARQRVCNLGFLRMPYVREDGALGYRCAAEPEKAYLAKGGKDEDLAGRKCLCNALVANIGLGQVLQDGSRERCLVTLGDDVESIAQFCSLEHPEFEAADVVRVLQGDGALPACASRGS